MSCFKKPLSPPLKKISRNYFHFTYRDFFKKQEEKKRKKRHKINREALEIGQFIYFQYTDSSFDVIQLY